MALARKECVMVLLCLAIMFGQTGLSESTELFDLSELTATQQRQLWTQVDNWAVAVVLANFCKLPTLLEERMLKIATGCVTRSSIKTLVERFHVKMNSVEGNVWDCTENEVKIFAEKTVAKANLLVTQADDACKMGSVYRQLLPFVQ